MLTPTGIVMTPLITHAVILRAFLVDRTIPVAQKELDFLTSVIACAISTVATSTVVLIRIVTNGLSGKC